MHRLQRHSGGVRREARRRIEEVLVKPAQTPRKCLALFVRTQKTSYLRFDAEAARKAYGGRRAS